MKKLVVLAMLFVAVAAWAQLTAGVTLDYMWAQDFGPGKEFSDRPIVELKFTYKADDFTSAYVELEEGPLSSQGDTTGIGGQGGFRNVYSPSADRGYNVQIAGLDRAYFTTDVGKVLKLSLPVVVMYGLNEWNGKDGIKVTKSEYEDYLGEADIRNWGAQIEVIPSPMVTVRSAWAWNPGAVQGQQQWLINAYGTVAPVSYELTYSTHAMGFENGWIEGGAKVVQDVTPDINVAAMVGFQVDMASTTDYLDEGGLYDANHYFAYGFPVDVTDDDVLVPPTSFWMVQAGLQIMFQKMAALGVSYRGAENMLAGAVQVQGYFTPKAGDPLEAFVQVGLGLDDEVFDTVFDSLEAALRYTMGKVQWYLGFEYSVEFGRDIAKEWADFDLANVPFGETSAIFMRGRVAL